MNTKDNVIVFVQSNEFKGLKREYNEVQYVNTTRDAKAYIFRNVIFPFFTLVYMTSYPHSLYLKVFLFCTFFYVNYRLPRPTKNVEFHSVLFGHRCCEEEDVVENSLEALTFAVEKGTRGFEIDIQLTKDKETVVFHDVLSISRLCDIPDSLKSVGRKRRKDTAFRVSRLTLEELKMCKFKGTQASIPTFDEFVTQLINFKRKLHLMVEVKEFARPRIMAKQLSKSFKKFPSLYEDSFVASFNPIFLYHMKKFDSDIVTCMCSHEKLFSEALYDNNEELKKNKLLAFPLRLFFRAFDVLFYTIGTSSILLRFLGVQIVSVNKDISVKKLKKFQKKGYHTICWTVNDEEEVEKLEKLNVSIVSDKPYKVKDLNQIEEEEEKIEKD